MPLYDIQVLAILGALTLGALFGMALFGNDR